VISFLTPPIYMLITSSRRGRDFGGDKSMGGSNALTLQNYIELLTSPTYLTFFRNSAVGSRYGRDHQHAVRASAGPHLTHR